MNRGLGRSPRPPALSTEGGGAFRGALCSKLTAADGTCRHSDSQGSADMKTYARGSFRKIPKGAKARWKTFWGGGGGRKFPRGGKWPTPLNEALYTVDSI